MRSIAYLKLSLKNLLASWQTVLIMLLALPIGIGLFLGTVFSVGDNHNLENIKFDLYIVDNDKTTSSKALIGLLSGKELQDIITITDEEEKNLKLIIPEGYERDLTALNEVNLLINNDADNFERKILNDILVNYHQGYYISQKNVSEEVLNELNSNSVEVELVETEKKDYYKETSLLGIAFAASMMIMTLAVGEYTPLAQSLKKKTSLAPMSKNMHFALEYGSNVIYVCIMLSIYITVYWILGLAFNGVLMQSLVAILGASVFISSFSILIVSFFKEKYGKLIATVTMMLPMVFQLMLPMIINNKVIEYLSPVYVVSEVFNKALSGSYFNIELVIMIFVAVVLYFVSRFKVNYDWRRGV